MESSICSQEETVNLYFVQRADDSPSSILLCASQACEEKFRTRWLSVEDCMQVTPTKEDIFICDPFEGQAFEYLVSCPKSIVVGPRCILSCLQRMEPIPLVPSPLHNTAMSRLVVTTTGFPKAEKEGLQRRVQHMSGIYSNNYHQDVTHLVVKMVGSEKYKVAVEQGVPTMTEQWVTAVWEAVVAGDTSEHVSATDECFQPYLCQPLHGLVVCVSQADQPTKMKLKRLIEENGGTYTTKLTMGETSVLIVTSPEGKKYNFAIKWGVPCVFPDWIYNSVQQGHAVDKEEYEVLPRKSSTFTNTFMGNEMPPDISMCSTILNDTATQKSIICVDETVSLEESMAGGRLMVEENSLDVEALESLDLQEAMRAGSFLKGHHVYLAGFLPAPMEKLRRVLAACGASRLSQLTPAATHVILATPREEHLRIMQGWSTKPHVVSVRWITESVHLKRPAEESLFAVPLEAYRDLRLPHLPSTATQRSSISSTHIDNDETHVDDRVLQGQFVLPGRRESGRRESCAREFDQDLSMLPESQASQQPGLFYGKTFTVSGHNQDELEEMIELHGGLLVQEGSAGPVHYLVMTPGGGFLHPAKGNLVSRVFVEDCVESQRLLAVEYYHLPLLLPGNSFPLEDCCITISTYAKYERYFLEHLVTLLGALNQEKFSKTDKADKNLLANTHLLCPTPVGAKYGAAMKWGIPAVTCDWLIECARSGQKVPGNNYLVQYSGDNAQLPRKAIIRKLWDSAMEVEEKGKEFDDDEEEEEVPPTPAMKKIKCVLSAEELASLSPDRPFDREAVSRMYPTPGTTRYYQAQREAALDAMPTPDTPYGTTWHADPPPRVRKCIKNIIDSLPEPLTPPADSPKDDLFKDFSDHLRQDLKKYKEKYRRLLEEVSAQKEREGDDGCQQDRDSHHLTDKDEGNECTESDLDIDNQGNKEEKNDAVEAKGEVQLSHQLEELARASLVERSGGIAGKGKAPPADLQRPTTPSKMHHIDLETQPNEEVEPLATQITWHDPEEHRARLTLQANMQKDTQNFSNPAEKETDVHHISSDDENSNKENIPAPQPGKSPHPPPKDKERSSTTITTPNPQQGKSPHPPHPPPKDKERNSTTTTTPKPQQAQHPVFLLVGMSVEEVKEYTEMVVQIGGEVSHSQTLEAQVTHLVAKMLSRSERTLMSIVSRRWVLIATYLDHSLLAGHFLKEESYAWGNPSAEHHPQMEPESTQANLAEAAWRWRSAMSGGPEQRGRQQQPFQNMTALFHTKKDRAKAFTRLIEAGGGHVISARPPYSEVEGVTHFFVEMETNHEKIDLGSFASRGIPCLKPFFINSCIMEDSPEISDFFIPEYKDILVNMSTCIPSPLKRAQRN